MARTVSKICPDCEELDRNLRETNRRRMTLKGMNDDEFRFNFFGS